MFIRLFPDDIIGQHLDAAKKMVEERGFIFRIDSFAGHDCYKALDYDLDRLNVRLDTYNNVIRAWFG